MTKVLGETRPLLLGHRGARFSQCGAENTPVAFDFAIARGCDGFEFDVRRSADGEAVICHDEVIRSGRVKIAERPASELGLPTLQEVLTRYKDTAFLDVELKVPGLEKTAADLFRESPVANGFVISSFLPDVLRRLREMDSTLPLGLICETQKEVSRWNALPVKYVILHHNLVEHDLVASLKMNGKKIFVWTVNQSEEMKRFARLGIDGIISDHPEKLVSAFASG